VGVGHEFTVRARDRVDRGLGERGAPAYRPRPPIGQPRRAVRGAARVAVDGPAVVRQLPAVPEEISRRLRSQDCSITRRVVATLIE
jgi:hypothetical protein